MESYFPASSAEYQANVLVAEGVWWNPKIGPTEIGHSAAYTALARYIKGEDLYLPPRNVWELRAVLRLYSDHVINSLFSQVRNLSPEYRTANAYARARQQCAMSLHAVLSPGNNLEILVALHTPPATPHYTVPQLDNEDESMTFEPTTASHQIKSR